MPDTGSGSGAPTRRTWSDTEKIANHTASAGFWNAASQAAQCHATLRTASARTLPTQVSTHCARARAVASATRSLRRRRVRSSAR